MQKKYSEAFTDPYHVNYTPDENEFFVLTHGDLWINNIMFQYTTDGSLNDTYFIDFQMGGFGSTAQDLTQFLLSSTALDIKLKNFDYFIAYYHQQLIEHLKFLNYQGKIPKLKDIHGSLFKHDCWGEFLMM